MLTDRIRINVKAGDGGHGGVHFEPGGKPSGANGSNGGDVYLEGTKHIYDLTKAKEQFEFKAENGTVGWANKKQPPNGKDIIIKVPLTTVVYDLDNNELMRIEKDGQKELLAQGGRGGLGNHYFRKGQISTLKKHTHGKPGEYLQLFLELRLQADVIFIGFPNAGKSSLLNALTNANAKVAAYPFTTLNPNLGVADNMVLMDLPGLIEGTAEGKGLGTRFKKHTEYARLVAHTISLESEDPARDYEVMRAELERIDKTLIVKPEIIVLTKSDLLLPEEIEQRIKEMQKYEKEIIVISSFHNKNILELLERFRQLTY